MNYRFASLAAVAVILVCGLSRAVFATGGQEAEGAQVEQSGQQGNPAPAQGSNAIGNTPASGTAQTGVTQLPDSPGAVRSQSASEGEQKSDPQQPPQQPTAQQPAQAGSQKPVGTAAAEIEGTSGVAASKPAGVAIAPAPQRRVRALLIKIGALAGAGVAIGTVFALSQATPSKPPGAH